MIPPMNSWDLTGIDTVPKAIRAQTDFGLVHEPMIISVLVTPRLVVQMHGIFPWTRPATRMDRRAANAVC